jgi:hypothetical protein
MQPNMHARYKRLKSNSCIQILNQPLTTTNQFYFKPDTADCVLFRFIINARPKTFDENNVVLRSQFKTNT